jgi:hypothetical protein
VSWTLAILFLACGSAAAQTTYYVDPTTGSASNDGSKDKPWKTLAEVVSSGALAKTKPGDTILLRSGNHGSVTITGSNTDFITIAAEKGEKPTLGQLTVSRAARWRIRGLTISPAFADQPYKGYIVALAEGGDAEAIELEDCFVYGALDSAKWDKTQWMGAPNGIIAGPNGKHHIVRNNYVLNVRHGINLCAEYSLAEGNVVSHFSADGMRLTRNGTAARYNVIKNAHVSMEDGDANHDDAIQCFVYHSAKGPLQRVSMVGNIFINREDDDQRLPNGGCHGIGCFDGPCVDFVVTDNVILTEAYQAITLNGPDRCRIERNMIWSRWLGQSKRHPWMQLAPVSAAKAAKVRGEDAGDDAAENSTAPATGGAAVKGDSGGAIVKDNCSPLFKLTAPLAVNENNKPASAELYDKALVKAYETICEKFGEVHAASGFERLDLKTAGGSSKPPAPPAAATSANPATLLALPAN